MISISNQERLYQGGGCSNIGNDDVCISKYSVTLIGARLIPNISVYLLPYTSIGSKHWK